MGSLRWAVFGLLGRDYVAMRAFEFAICATDVFGASRKCQVSRKRVAKNDTSRALFSSRSMPRASTAFRSIVRVKHTTRLRNTSNSSESGVMDPGIRLISLP